MKILETISSATNNILAELEKEQAPKMPLSIKLVLVALFFLPLLVQFIGLAIGKPNLGYWIFAPDTVILLFLVARFLYKRYLKNV